MIIIIIIIYIGEPRPFIVIGKEEKKYLKKLLPVPAGMFPSSAKATKKPRGHIIAWKKNKQAESTDKHPSHGSWASRR